MVKKLQIIRTMKTVQNDITGKSREIAVLVNMSTAQEFRLVLSFIGYEIFSALRLILDAPLIIRMNCSIPFFGTLGRVMRQQNMW